MLKLGIVTLAIERQPHGGKHGRLQGWVLGCEKRQRPIGLGRAAKPVFEPVCTLALVVGTSAPGAPFFPVIVGCCGE
jgi:hypothetical protein